MATKKYEIDKSDSIIHGGKTLYRIKALKSFNTADGGVVLKGKLGGFIESENNLSQNGNCWIFNEAKVFGCAKILDNAVIRKNAEIFGNAVICDNALVDDDAFICANSRISGCAKIFNKAAVYSNAKIFDSATVYDKAKVFGNAQIFENAEIFEDSKILGNAKIHGYSYIFGDAVVCDNAEILGNAEISGTAIVFGVAKIGDNQKIKTGEFMYDAVDITTLLPRVQAMHKQVLRMCAGKYLIDKNYLDNVIKEFTEYDKARKAKEEFYHVTLPLKTGEVCALLEEISNALEKIEKSKRFNKDVDNQ